MLLAEGISAWTTLDTDCNNTWKARRVDEFNLQPWNNEGEREKV